MEQALLAFLMLERLQNNLLIGSGSV